MCSYLTLIPSAVLQARILDGCCALLQGIFLTQELNLSLLHLLHWQVGSLPLAPPGKPIFLPGESHREAWRSTESRRVRHN